MRVAGERGRIPDPVPLPAAEDESQYGGKAVQLGAASRAGLPVPRGLALPAALVDAVGSSVGEALERVRRACEDPALRGAGPGLAVRSSGVGEDSAGASFAGQHLTRLNVTGREALLAAIVEVWRSTRTEAARAYRARMGIGGLPATGVVIQEMVEADCSGVLFTRNPIDGSDERVIEAAWGLGEAVVSGMVEPDRYHLLRGGAAREVVLGEKDVRVRMRPDGDTEAVPVEPHLRGAPCLDARMLVRLDELATRCELHFEGAHDIEWAFAAGRLYLLQRRAITR